MTDIDWSKAPEGANYFAPGEGFVRIVEGIVHYWEREWRENGCKQGDYAEGFLIARPATCDGNHSGPRCADPGCWNDDLPAWSGEGLPPVGTVCEMRDDLGVWHRATVIAHGVERGEAVGIGQANDLLLWCKAGHHCRPIRTPEQIAAEEREAAIAQMKGCFDSVSDRLMPTSNRDLETLFGALHDAGYRKQVQP